MQTQDCLWIPKCLPLSCCISFSFSLMFNCNSWATGDWFTSRGILWGCFTSFKAMSTLSSFSCDIYFDLAILLKISSAGSLHVIIASDSSWKVSDGGQNHDTVCDAASFTPGPCSRWEEDGMEAWGLFRTTFPSLSSSCIIFSCSLLFHCGSFPCGVCLKSFFFLLKVALLQFLLSFTYTILSPSSLFCCGKCFDSIMLLKLSLLIDSANDAFLIFDVAWSFSGGRQFCGILDVSLPPFVLEFKSRGDRDGTEANKFVSFTPDIPLPICPSLSCSTMFNCPGNSFSLSMCDRDGLFAFKVMLGFSVPFTLTPFILIFLGSCGLLPGPP